TITKMCDSQPPPDRKKGEPKRRFNIVPGDFNQNIHNVLSDHPVKQREAAFCLLDQRTLECDWSSVQAVAMHKQANNKIELFYFLPHAWVDRTVAALGNRDAVMVKWWGGDGWKEWLTLRGIERAQFACRRFKEELKYKHVYPFPIYER